MYLAALLDCYIRGQEGWAELRKKYDRSGLFHFADTEQTRRETTQNLWQTAFSLHWTEQLFHIYFETSGFTKCCSEIQRYCNIFTSECIFDTFYSVVSSNWNNFHLLFKLAQYGGGVFKVFLGLVCLTHISRSLHSIPSFKLSHINFEVSNNI